MSTEQGVEVKLEESRDGTRELAPPSSIQEHVELRNYRRGPAHSLL